MKGIQTRVSNLISIISDLITGKRPVHFILAVIWLHKVRRRSLRMSIYTTSKCNLDCKECIMGGLMKDKPRLALTLEQLTRFLKVSESSGYLFEIVFTGGEPLLWRHFRASLPILRQSPAVEKITLFTNALHIEPLDEVTVSMLDSIRISEYSNNTLNIQTLLKRWPNKVSIVDRTEFYENPREAAPVTGSADCMNDEMILIGDEIYACPHSLAISLANNLPGVYSKPVEPNFIRGVGLLKRSQSKSVCKYCISNRKVRNITQKIKNSGKQTDTVETSESKAI